MNYLKDNSPASRPCGIFYFMTLHELLKQSGLSFTRKDAERIGLKVMTKAKEQKVRWTKKQELIEVNDYPAEFVSEMQQLLISHFSNKKSAK